MELAWDKVITWDIRSGDVSELQRLTQRKQFRNKQVLITEQLAAANACAWVPVSSTVRGILTVSITSKLCE